MEGATAGVDHPQHPRGGGGSGGGGGALTDMAAAAAAAAAASADEGGGGGGGSAGGAAAVSPEQKLVVETFERYSKTQEGAVTPEELREMMADLNSGIYPTDQEVRHVMWFADGRQRGCLDPMEFESAVTFWYIHTMEMRERAKSHCCAVL